jgi:hypothetical protein
MPVRGELAKGGGDDVARRTNRTQASGDLGSDCPIADRVALDGVTPP